MLGAILGGGLDFLGGILGNKSRKDAADKQMAFQERMSNTAYQRSMEDMRKAGLNPMLAYQKGGASTPGGAQPNIKNVAENSSKHVANITQAKLARANIDNLNSAAALNRSKADTEATIQSRNNATTAVDLARATTEGLRPGQVRAETFLTEAKTRTETHQADIASQVFQNKMREGTILWNQITKTEAEAVRASILLKIYATSVGEAAVWLKELGITKPSELISWAKKPKKKPKLNYEVTE